MGSLKAGDGCLAGLGVFENDALLLVEKFCVFFFFNPSLSARVGFSSSLKSDPNGISRAWCIKNV